MPTTETLRTPHEIVKSNWEFVESWFKEHTALEYEKATFQNSGLETTRILWSKPRSVWYRQNYLLLSGTLVSYGDIGDALWSLTEIATPEKVAAYNFDYFMGKLRSDESSHRRGKRWDPDYARAVLQELINERATSAGVEPCSLANAFFPMLDNEISEILRSEFDFASYLRDSPLELSCSNEGIAILDLTECGSCGYTWTTQYMGIFRGLQLAVADLKTKGLL